MGAPMICLEIALSLRRGARAFTRAGVDRLTGTSLAIETSLCAGGRSRLVAVGPAVARCPPHSPVLARFTHTVPALNVWRRNALSDTGAGSQPLAVRHRVAP